MDKQSQQKNLYFAEGGQCPHIEEACHFWVGECVAAKKSQCPAEKQAERHIKSKKQKSPRGLSGVANGKVFSS